MSDNIRMKQVAEMLRQEISLLLLKDLNDSMISGNVTITFVKVANDFSSSHAFFRVNGNKNPIELEKKLNKAASYIKKKLTSKLTIKRVPNIHFEFDRSQFDANRLDSLFRDVSALREITDIND